MGGRCWCGTSTKPAGMCKFAARLTEVCQRTLLGLRRKMSHSPGVQGIISDKRGTIWSLDRDYDLAARSAVVAAVDHGRLPGVGLFGLLRRPAGSSVKRRVGDSAPELLIGMGGRSGDDHRRAEHGGGCARGEKPLGDHSSTPFGEGTWLSRLPVLSQHSLHGGTANPQYLTRSSVSRKREARRERSSTHGDDPQNHLR